MTTIGQICEIMETILSHQPVIDVPYEKLNEIAVALVKEGYGNISEYKAEIERLKEKCEELRNEKWDSQDDLDCYCDEMPNKIKQAKIDVLNELKERIKNRNIYTYFNSDGGGYYLAEDVIGDIELLKEYENGKDKS